MCGLKRGGGRNSCKDSSTENGYYDSAAKRLHISSATIRPAYPPIFNCQCSYSNSKSKLFNYTNYTKYFPQCQEKIILNVLFFNSFLVIPMRKIKSPILRNYYKLFKNVKYILHLIYPIVRWNYGCNR